MLQFTRTARERGQRGGAVDGDADVGETARSASQLAQHEGEAMTQRQPVGRQILLLHQVLKRPDNGIIRREVQNRVAELAPALPREVRLCRIDLDRLQQQHVGVEPQSGALGHQPHAEEIAELQDGPVAPASVRLGRAQPFGKGMRQDRLGLGIADTIGQARQWIETVDGDVVAGGDLRPQAGQPQPVERAVPESDDVRPHPRRLRLTKEPRCDRGSRNTIRSHDQAQARSFFSFAS